MSAALEGRAAEGRGAAARVEALDWQAAAAGLDGGGWAVLPKLLTSEECHGVAGLYEDDGRFRSRVVMARHGFGRDHVRQDGVKCGVVRGGHGSCGNGGDLVGHGVDCGWSEFGHGFGLHVAVLELPLVVGFQ